MFFSLNSAPVLEPRRFFFGFSFRLQNRGTFSSDFCSGSRTEALFLRFFPPVLGPGHFFFGFSLRFQDWGTFSLDFRSGPRTGALFFRFSSSVPGFPAVKVVVLLGIRVGLHGEWCFVAWWGGGSFFGRFPSYSERLIRPVFNGPEGGTVVNARPVEEWFVNG